MRRCVFFDRDGIVNTSPGPGYVERVADFHIEPAFLAAVPIVAAAGYGLAIITNQRGVALGRMTPADVDAIHGHLSAVLAEYQAPLLGIYCCTHERNSCTCRKPQPGLLLQAAAEHDLDLTASWMVGDKETDVEAGRRVGCRTILVDGQAASTRATRRVSHLAQLPQVLQTVLLEHAGDGPK